MGWTKAKRKAAAKKAAKTRKQNSKKKPKKRETKRKTGTSKKPPPQQKGADKISDSEGKYMEVLKEKFGTSSIVFKTGNAKKEDYPNFAGVPDIAVYSDGKLSFYEIKPGFRGSDNSSDPKPSFLKSHQEKWIKNNCFKYKKLNVSSPPVYLIFYKKGRTVYKYWGKRIKKSNLQKYSQTSSAKKRKTTLKSIRSQTFRKNFIPK